MTPSSDVSTSVDGAAAYLSLGVGYRHNAMRAADWVALRDAASALGADESVNVVVIRGAGGTFSAGSDIREWAGADSADIDASFHLMEQALSAVERIPIPTIALVEGVAAGAGCQLALSCDMCVMADSA
ncbi:MAG TPA: enoyl-CoA hydratase/isomerase family protein, partial [Acidothermaceae bacterium]